MPRAPADAKRKRDPRLRPLKAPVDPWAWVIEDKPRRHQSQEQRTGAKPSFYGMVAEALMSNKMHLTSGVGLTAILKYVAVNFEVDADSYRRSVRAAIKRAVEDGKIESVEGPSTAYRLSAAERKNFNGKKQNQEVRATKSKKKNAGAAGVTSTKRGTVGGGRASKNDMDSDSEEEAPRKPKKKAAKKNANARLNENDHLQQQAGEGKWVWQYQDGGWHDYDSRGSDEVEMTYQLYEKEKATGRIIDVRAVRSGTWEYQVDFRQFTQTNIQHAAHTVRAIRRIWRSA